MSDCPVARPAPSGPSHTWKGVPSEAQLSDDVAGDVGFHQVALLGVSLRCLQQVVEFFWVEFLGQGWAQLAVATEGHPVPHTPRVAPHQALQKPCRAGDDDEQFLHQLSDEGHLQALRAFVGLEWSNEEVGSQVSFPRPDSQGPGDAQSPRCS